MSLDINKENKPLISDISLPPNVHGKLSGEFEISVLSYYLVDKENPEKFLITSQLWGDPNTKCQFRPSMVYSQDGCSSDLRRTDQTTMIFPIKTNSYLFTQYISNSYFIPFRVESEHSMLKYKPIAINSDDIIQEENEKEKNSISYSKCLPIYRDSPFYKQLDNTLVGYLESSLPYIHKNWSYFLDTDSSDMEDEVSYSTDSYSLPSDTTSIRTIPLSDPPLGAFIMTVTLSIPPFSLHFPPSSTSIYTCTISFKNDCIPTELQSITSVSRNFSRGNYSISSVFNSIITVEPTTDKIKFLPYPIRFPLILPPNQTVPYFCSDDFRFYVLFTITSIPKDKINSKSYETTKIQGVLKLYKYISSSTSSTSSSTRIKLYMVDNESVIYSYQEMPIVIDINMPHTLYSQEQPYIQTV
ncbi:hypothetical protein WA158_007604 [Blastocystis sp. Blastoise]